MEPSRLIYLVGALPFLFLGTAHAIATPLKKDDRKGLAPVDPALSATMARSAVLLTNRTDVWRAWVGFNLSHSLGAIIFGLFVVITGRSVDVFAMEAAIVLPLAIIITGFYLVLGLRYWFRIPVIGIGCSLACFSVAFLLRALR